MFYSPPSGTQCCAAAATAPSSTARTLPSRPRCPPLKLGATGTCCRPHGQKAGGARPHGSDAGDIQLHAGDAFAGERQNACHWCWKPIGSCCLSQPQDSMLEFDGPPIDPAIISAQPMKPAANMELPQMVCPPGRFPQSN